MKLFTASSPTVEVNGETVLAIVAGMGAFKANAIKILEENGITNPAAGQWYAQQKWLNAFKVISDKLGRGTLTQIGGKILENAKWPPQVNSVETALSSIDVAYHMNHRNGEIGHYKFQKVGPNSVTVTCDNPYPCAFDLGLIQAAAKKFAGGAMVKVAHDESKGCRHKSGAACVYSVTWG